MARWNTIARGSALAAVAALALAACSFERRPQPTSGSPCSQEEMSLRSRSAPFLPLPASLAFLGPPEVAGVDLAIKEINDAGGVLGTPCRS